MVLTTGIPIVFQRTSLYTRTTQSLAIYARYRGKAKNTPLISKTITYFYLIEHLSTP